MVRWSLLASVASASEYKVDVLIYGATPAGFAASLAAKATGAQRVLVLEPTPHVGGMASPGGIGLRDCQHDEVRDNPSTQKEWAMRNAAKYGQKVPSWQPDGWVGEETFREMMQERGVELWTSSPMREGSAGVKVSKDRRVEALALENGTWIEAAYIIDASYEGEVMIAAGCDYTFGREAQSTYNESLGGVAEGSKAQFPVDIDPYVEGTKTLLPWIQDFSDPRQRVGKADQAVMGYSFRACLTDDASNLVPFKEPAGYDPADFELPRRLILAELAAGITPKMPWGDLTYHGYPSSKTMKYDACCGGSPVGIDAIGLAVGYANATRAERQAIYNKHKYYVQGLMWFWATDPAVPEETRKSIQSKGLCKDEWPENDHFPPQLYVREAARVVGDKVFTQNSRKKADEPGGCLPDAVAISSWGYDIHEMERVAVMKDGQPVVYNEGLTSPGTGGDFMFEIPFWVVLPKRKDAVNLAVPNVPSVSHVAWAGIREEPTLWQLGQAAGTAAALALKSSSALHDVNITLVQDALISQQTFVHWPPRARCSDPLLV